MEDKRDSPLRRFLATVAHASAPFISTFVLIHLSAPILANVGGSSLASNVMLLGREYYQSDFAEKALILGPITVHVLSALLNRLLSPKPSENPRKWQGPMSITGYSVALVYLPIHYLTHRAYPSTPTSPINSVGPGELDYEFVKHGLHTWPVRSWLLYGSLTIFTAFHLAIGSAMIWNKWMKPLLPSVPIGSAKLRTRLVLGGLALPALTGLFFLSREPTMAFSSTLKRYTAAFMTSSVYRI